MIGRGYKIAFPDKGSDQSENNPFCAEGLALAALPGRVATLDLAARCVPFKVRRVFNLEP